ncbi:MAG: hypothetical protein ACHQT9_04235 [Candidatus Saccharimonadales bacterium]
MYTKSRQRILAATSLFLISLAFSILPVSAAKSATSSSSGGSTNTSASGSVTQSYNASGTVLTSMIVEYKPKDKTSVIPLADSEINKMLGVVIPSSNATIVLTPLKVTTQQVLVAQSGSYSALVSNQTGAIKAGDYLTISALPGIAMKASANQTVIVGRALANYDGSTAITSATLKNAQGASIKVGIGRIPVDLQLAPNPLYLKNSNSIFVFLTRAEYDITNKPVSPVRTYLVGLVFLATILITGIVLYSGTRSSISSIGRNPLAKSAIGRGMLKTVAVGLLVFVIGVGAIYLILNK